ncbi:hypothetical protein Ahy_B08g092445 [Arachis hypogaea]|uniref:Transposase MuDR plant domain-containing protein n=1 Tax=Arachis hypogaea TaxID=3818 RepID=A0A444Y3R9_ARAHY|nr:hypothetical protein Ahy_B08g092445 [Arachis hypogaea]
MYERGCDWLIRASLIRKKGCWEIRRYNGRHTCTIGTISQDHSKLDSDTVAEAIRPLVETDPSIKVKSIIAEVQSRFNYTISYRKAWLAKQKSIAKVFSGWEDSYQALPWWLSIMVQKKPGSVVQIETRPLYNGNEEAHGTPASAGAADPPASAGANGPGLYSSTTVYARWIKPLSHDALPNVWSLIGLRIPWPISTDALCGSADYVGEDITLKSDQPPKPVLVQ